MIGHAIDSLLGILSPSWGMKRAAARATMSQIQSFSGGPGGYDAGKLNRLTKASNNASHNENGIPRGQVQRLRWASWDLYRNNPHAKKICRSLESKVIGRGPVPQSQATLADGQPHVEFRKRARELWDAWGSQCDYRGRPGYGGQSLVDLCKVALRGTILGGEVLYRHRYTSGAELPQKSQRKTVPPPIKLQLIHADRLDDTITSHNGNRVFYGIELDVDFRRLAYHVLDYHPSDPMGMAGARQSKPIPAGDVGHLFVGEDIDQIRGVPWFSAALLKMRDTGDYEFNELKAAAMAACVVLGYRRSAGQSGFGIEQPEDWDLEDGDGNKITALQPGMLLDLGRTGEIQGFNPQRPNTGASDFIAHMLRSQAAAVPGVKGSTITMDYRNSSFSSERSADNDAWPEIEGLQDWFNSAFCQPVYERLIIAGIESGWFDGIVDPQEFADRRAEFLKSHWQGPIARSINPVDDVEAAVKRIAAGLSTPQIEAAKLGCNWQELMVGIKEYIDYGTEVGVPLDIILQAVGIPQKDFGESPAAGGATEVNKPVTDTETTDGDESETNGSTGEAA